VIVDSGAFGTVCSMNKLLIFSSIVAAAFAAGFLVRGGVTPQDNLSLRPLPQQGSSLSLQKSVLSEARASLSRNDWTQAASALAGSRRVASPFAAPTDPVDAATIEAFLGVIAEQQNRPSEASLRFTRAAESSGAFEQGAFFACLADAVAPVAPSRSGVTSWISLFENPFVLSAMAVLEAGGAAPQPEHSKSQKALTTLVTEARSEFEQDASLENKIKLLTALILFGELASRPEEQSYSDANEAFSAGIQMLAEVERELKDDPKKDRDLSENRPLAVRFDVVRFRQAKIREKSIESANRERERVEKLQRIVLAYRDMAGDFATAMSAQLTNDEPRALAGIDESLAQLRDIQKAVDESKDFYLLTKPPNVVNDKNPDEELVYNEESPFTPRLSSESHILRGITRYRIATQSNKALDEKTVSASLQDVATGLENGEEGDPDNVLGLYSAGILHEEQADLLLNENPADKAARDTAKKAYGTAKSFLTKARDKTKDLLAEEIDRRLNWIDDPQAIIQQARTETDSGNLRAARATLQAGIHRHDDLAVWVEWAAAVSRDGGDKQRVLDVLDAASQAAVIDSSNPQFAVCRGRVAINAIVAATALGLEDLDKDTRQKYADRCSEVADQLRAAAAKLQAVDKAVCESFQSLASAYGEILLADNKERQSRAAESYALCKTSHKVLEEEVAQPGQPLDLQEALVACRLALGYLATATIPEFQDDAIASFAGVLDERSKLAGSPADLKVMGAPLVAALRDRPLDAGQQSVSYEQRLRRSMVSLLDGTVSLQYGAPEESAQFLEDGLVRLRSQAAEKDQLPDAARLFNDSDTYEVERYLEDFMSVFAVLADVEAGRGKEALEKAIRRVDPEALKTNAEQPLEAALTANVLERVIQRTKSPMASYAVGRALEAYALSLGLSDGPTGNGKALLDFGRRAIAEAKQATTPWLADRYPAFVTLLQQSEQRFAGADSYLAQVRQLRAQGRYDEAVKELQKAVRLYRDNRDLWRLWVEIELANAVEAAAEAANQKNDKQATDKLADLKRVITNGQANGAFTDADRLYFEGVVEDRLGRVREALALYGRAIATDNLDSLYRVRAKARIAVLKLDRRSASSTSSPAPAG
jgi:tetratricopeptide (TPR) repeat protein